MFCLSDCRRLPKLTRQCLLRREFITIPRIQNRLAHIRKIEHLAGQALQSDGETAVGRHS